MHPVAIGKMVHGRSHDVPAVLFQSQIQLGHGNRGIIRRILGKIIEMGGNLVSKAEHIVLLSGNGLGVRVNILNQRAHLLLVPFPGFPVLLVGFPLRPQETRHGK